MGMSGVQNHRRRIELRQGCPERVADLILEIPGDKDGVHGYHDGLVSTGAIRLLQGQGGCHQWIANPAGYPLIVLAMQFNRSVDRELLSSPACEQLHAYKVYRSWRDNLFTRWPRLLGMPFFEFVECRSTDAVMDFQSLRPDIASEA